MKNLDIADVAAQSGLAASTLRFYEEKRLIASVGRRGLRRQYAGSVLERLAVISLGRSAGFTLEEIGILFASDGRIRKALLAEKAATLEKTIRRLRALHEGLRHAAVCPAPSHLECPTFRRHMRTAARINRIRK